MTTAAQIAGIVGAAGLAVLLLATDRLARLAALVAWEIGRASCRERVL